MATVATVQEQPVLISSVSLQQRASLGRQQTDYSIQQVFPIQTLDNSATAASHEHYAEPVYQQVSVSTVSQVHVAHVEEQHPTDVVQHDLDLWNRVREYDQRSFEESFTTVLTKKQKKQLKVQILGNPQYRTHSRGEPSPTRQ